MTAKKADHSGASLVIVESPAKAKTINKILGHEYEVTASMGHVRDLPTSKFGVDVEKGFEPEYKVLQTRKKLVKELQQVAASAKEIFLAPDPDREGEAIAWHLAEILDSKNKKISRVTFNEITTRAVLEAFKHTRPIDMKRVDSQQARRILDRIVGYKISPLLWKKVQKGLSAGRVQSVAVRMICEREEEIKNFVPKEYWSIEGLFKKAKIEDASFEARLDRIKGEKIDISNQASAQSVVDDLQSLKETFAVVNVQSKDKVQRPYPPLITSQLQQAAANVLKYSVQKTMKVAQELYEGIELGSEGSIGLITYMRTDSVRIADEAQKEAKDYIINKHGASYIPATPNVYKSKKGAQEAHEAIRPTSVAREPDQIKDFLTQDQYKLYRLIWKRFLQSQMSPAQLKVHTVEIAANEGGVNLQSWQTSKYIFKATGTEVVFPGYLVLEEPVKKEETEEEDEDQEKEVHLPSLEPGERLELISLKPGQHFTKPPPRYNEASLVKALEEKEIGRPSTYAPIIQTILKRNYVTKERAKLIPTELGFTVTKLLIEHFPEIINVEFTAKMEADLDRIEEGQQDWRQLLSAFYQPFMNTLDEASKNMKVMKVAPIPTSEVCEKCGSMMVIRTGRFGKFMACSGYPKCKNVKSLDTGVACPKPGCTGKVVKRRSKKGRFFYGCTRYPDCDFTASDLKKLQPNESENSQDSSQPPPASQSL